MLDPNATHQSEQVQLYFIFCTKKIHLIETAEARQEMWERGEDMQLMYSLTGKLTASPVTLHFNGQQTKRVQAYG